uniref:Uncharacterized protein n=1 Tax=Arundo donax TaxID=35708 RepID=A0A0A9DGE2_ARUDO
MARVVIALAISVCSRVHLDEHPTGFAGVHARRPGARESWQCRQDRGKAGDTAWAGQ